MTEPKAFPYILKSIGIHMILFGMLLLYGLPLGPPKDSGPITIDIVAPPKPKQSPQNTGNLILPPKRQGKDKGDKGDTGEKITKQITLENYADRVKAVIDPIWYRLIKERMRQLKAQGVKVYVKTSEVTVTVNASGAIIHKKLTRSSGRLDFDRIALQTFDMAGQLPPPPSNLLENGKFILWWEFTLTNN